MTAAQPLRPQNQPPGSPPEPSHLSLPLPTVAGGTTIEAAAHALGLSPYTVRRLRDLNPRSTTWLWPHPVAVSASG